MAKDVPTVSVVIPAYNEATYIDRLLEALTRQEFDNFEVIVSDAESRDGTKEVVWSFKGKLAVDLIQSPPRGPANGRNLGAQKSRGEWLLFLDADVDIEDADFIKKLVDGAKAKNWSTTSGQLKVGGKSLIGKIGHSQGYMNLMAHTKHPIAQGYCIMTRRQVFEDQGGFNEKIMYGEDNDYVSRTAKYGFGFIKNAQYIVDPRRYEQEGVKLLFKNMRHEFYRLTHGFNFENNKSAYEFGKHKARVKH